MKSNKLTQFVVPNSFLEKYDLDLTTVLLLYLTYKNVNIVNLLAQLEHLGIITLKSLNQGVLVPQMIPIMEELTLLNDLETPPDEVLLLELVKNMQEVFPKGIKPGTNVPWRGNKYEIKQKLLKFQDKFNIPLEFDKILAATKSYVNSFNGNFKTMHTLKYFILKNVVVDGEMEVKSELLSFLDNDISEDDNMITDDYFTNLL